MRIVAYQRVSTIKQGHSGLGLEAQTTAVAAHAVRVGGTITASFVEVKSGKANDRPKLAQALHLAKVTGAKLLIAKLDRLSRNAAFLLTLRDSGVKFVAADMPDANDLTIGIMALVAQQERETISRRTKEALAAAKARGRRLGNPNEAAALLRAGRGNRASRQAANANADRFARDLAPVVAQLREEGDGIARCHCQGAQRAGDDHA
jgi:DNA invertase Pin-like site-specific DNA recombinase